MDSKPLSLWDLGGYLLIHTLWPCKRLSTSPTTYSTVRNNNSNNSFYNKIFLKKYYIKVCRNHLFYFLYLVNSKKLWNIRNKEKSVPFVTKFQSSNLRYFNCVSEYLNYKYVWIKTFVYIIKPFLSIRSTYIIFVFCLLYAFNL